MFVTEIKVQCGDVDFYCADQDDGRSHMIQRMASVSQEYFTEAQLEIIKDTDDISEVLEIIVEQEKNIIEINMPELYSIG